ncbi:MAG: hypothetical protein FWH22_05925 [Fibromonadales bacterium]|nr:hypothetical protein [Fibromonadales bacterium]
MSIGPSPTNNRAWSEMMVNGNLIEYGTANNGHGEDMSTAEAYALLKTKRMRLPEYMYSVDYPFLIYTAEDLDNIRKGLDKHYVLMDDIDLTKFIEANETDGEGWEPIGDDTSYPNNMFTGSLTNPNGYIIRGLRINRPDDADVGLFGFVGNDGTVSDDGTVSGVLLENVNIVGSNYVGAVVGTNYFGTVNNCVVTGTVSGNDSDIGGVVGRTLAGTVSNNVALLGNVSGTTNVSRVVGNDVARVGADTFTGNKAWSGTLVNGTIVTDGTGNNENGENLGTVAAIDLLGDLEMSVPQYLLDAAADEKAIEDASEFKLTHKPILDTEAEDVAISDKESVAAALTAYEALSTLAKDKLIDGEKQHLDALLAKIEDLEEEAAVAATEAEANAFKTAHAAILAKTVDNVAISDKAAVAVALTAYEALTPAAKALLATEKNLLENLKAKITELEEATPIIANRENRLIGAIGVQTIYYDLKGTPLGTIKPTTPGVYIEKQGKQTKRIVVR